MKEPRESVALIASLRNLEERQAPTSVRRHVAERLENTLFGTKPERRLGPVWRFRLAPLSFAMVVVGTTGVLFASVHVMRTVWPAETGSEAPAPPETQVSGKVQVAHRKFSQPKSNPLPAALARTALTEEAPLLPAPTPAPLTTAAKPTLALRVPASQPLLEHANAAASLPNRGAVASFDLPSPTAQPTSELKEERAILDRARSFIRAGNAHAADQALAEHATRFATGRHAEEREALKVFSAGLRSQSEGRAAAFAFHSRHPNSLFWRGIAEELRIR